MVLGEAKKSNYKQTLHMRRNYLGKTCKLHYDAAPLKVVRASKQYMYDESGTEYLDSINCCAHVGHCHPHVVQAGQEQMAKLTTCNGFLTDHQSIYAKRLIETMPDRLCVCFFVNSGSEANDLAIRLARAYTKKEDLIIIDEAYHGNLGNTYDISPVRIKSKNPNWKKEWVHTVPCPNTYRGIYRESAANVSECYSNEVLNEIKKAASKGRQVAAFISEPLMAMAGVVNPPQNYLKQCYKHTREAGGLCIADEILVGLGRVGEHWWAFQTHDVVPDIVTIGKPIGNGHPMAAVVTTPEIADALDTFASGFGGNPVSCAIGLAVLDVIRNERLLSSARSVGKCLIDGFRAILPDHPMMGDVRGIGMVVGVELVTDKESRKPATEATELLIYKMKEHRVLLNSEGYDKNVILLTPPLCFTCDNARHLIHAFGTVLAEIERGTGSLPTGGRSEYIMNTGDQIRVPLSIVLGDAKKDDSEGSEGSDGEAGVKRARYDDLD